MEYLPYQQRVVDEKVELDIKLKKLISFFDTQIFFQLPEVERNRLTMQSYMMKEYSTILGERIEAFTEKE